MFTANTATSTDGLNDEERRAEFDFPCRRQSMSEQAAGNPGLRKTFTPINMHSLKLCWRRAGVTAVENEFTKCRRLHPNGAGMVNRQLPVFYLRSNLM